MPFGPTAITGVTVNPPTFISPASDSVREVGVPAVVAVAAAAAVAAAVPADPSSPPVDSDFGREVNKGPNT